MRYDVSQILFYTVSQMVHVDGVAFAVFLVAFGQVRTGPSMAAILKRSLMLVRALRGKNNIVCLRPTAATHHQANMFTSMLNQRAHRDAERAKARAWRCPLESVSPTLAHTTAPDKRPLKQEDVAYLGPASQGTVGAVVCQKCYNRRTTAKRKEAKAKGIPQRVRNCSGTDTACTQLELQVQKLQRKLRQSEAGRRTALRQLSGSSNAGVLPTSSHAWWQGFLPIACPSAPSRSPL